jgi:hypothetical protein
MPARKARIQLNLAYSLEEYESITRGFVPRRMEDKWFVFLEDDTLFCHRSWVGFCIYVVRFAKRANEYVVAECWVNRDAAQYQETEEEQDASIVRYLVDRLLLGKPGRVAIRAASDEEAALRMWSLFGHARPNDEPSISTFKVTAPAHPASAEESRDRPGALRASAIKPLRTEASDYAETEKLKVRFRRLRAERNPFYLTRDELDPVFKWKLRSQYGRVRWRLKQNSDERCRVITRLAFSVTLDDKDLELELRTGILTMLHGVGVPVASAILALVDPENYCVIDFRAWRAVFGEKLDAFDVRHYKKYLDEVRKLAAELGWTPQEVDLAIWAYDYQANQNRKGEAAKSVPEAEQPNEDG